MNMIKKISILQLVFVVMLAGGFSACKSKKKVSDVSDAEMVKQQMEDEATEELPPPTQPEEEITPTLEPVEETPTQSEQLQGFMQQIVSASDINAANQQIQQALTMFSNSNAPVLIVIYSGNGQADYDEPTTISKYLNYLKDTKNLNVLVEDMVTDQNGKIKELVLRKK